MRTKAFAVFLGSYALLTIGCGGVPATVPATTSSTVAIAAVAPTTSSTVAVAAPATTSSTVTVASARRLSNPWTVSPTSLAFGQVAVGASGAQSVTVTNSSSNTAAIDSASLNGAGFALAPTTFPIDLKSGASTTLQVIFAPSSTGTSNGTLSLATSTSSTLSVSLSGSGVAPLTQVQHTVTLTWLASPSIVDGYYIYRGTQSGGPYTRLNSSPTPITTYQDSTVSSGTTYYYAVTAVESGTESVRTSDMAGVVPSP